MTTLRDAKLPSICFIGPMTLPLLAPEYGHRHAGGSELQQALLAKALARRGFRISMVVNDYGQRDGAQWDGVTTYKAYRDDGGIPIVRFIHPRWTSTWAAMRRADADIYYLNCQSMQVGQTVLFARAHGRKTVYWVASDADCSPQTLLMRYWRDRKLFEYGLRRADVVLAQTTEQQAAMRRNFGRDSLLMDSLVDSRGTVRPLRERDIDVLWVGNIRSLKRPELLIELARRMPGLRFHMIGGPVQGSLELYESLHRAAAELPNLSFHGLVPYHRVGEFYARARVFVSTSAVEGLPNAYLQSWACGAPVVAFLDPERMIATRRLGFAVSTLEEMQSAVTLLGSDRGEWAATSARCIEYVSSRYAESGIVSRYIDVLCALHSGAAFAPVNSTTATPGVP